MAQSPSARKTPVAYCDGAGVAKTVRRSSDWFAIGLSGLAFLQHATEASEYTLILLLFLVGIQLRNNGMTLKQIVLNRRGMIVAVVVVASSLTGGLINAFILDLPINTALAMASGFGWYSLSGILLTESFGPVIGSAAFLMIWPVS